MNTVFGDSFRENDIKLSYFWYIKKTKKTITVIKTKTKKKSTITG